MDLESRIHDYLVAEDAERRGPVDSYERIVARGRRRRLQSYATQIVAVAAVLGLVVAGAGLLRTRGAVTEPVGPPPESSVIDIGNGLLATPGEIGPAPLKDPSGLEVQLLPIVDLNAADRARLKDTGENLREDIPIGLIGAIEGSTMKVLVAHSTVTDEQGNPEDLICQWVLGPKVGMGKCGPATTGISEPGIAHLEGDSYLLVGAVTADTSYVSIDVSGIAVWQRPVSNIVALPITATSEDTITLTVHQDNGNTILTKSFDERVDDTERLLVLGEAQTRWDELGLGRIHPEVWLTRLQTICSNASWEPGLSLRLAEQFITEDVAASSSRESGSQPTAADGADALNDIVGLACPKIFPVDSPPATTTIASVAGVCTPDSRLVAGYLSVPDPEAFPLSSAIYSHDVARVEQLLADGVDPDAELVETEGARPLAYAAMTACEDTVGLLLAAGASPDPGDTDYQPIVAAAVGGSGRIVEMLVAAGAPVDSPSGVEGWYPIQHAAYVGAVDSVQALITAGASLDTTNDLGESALLWSSLVGHVEVVELLLRSGAELGVTPLVAAAEAGNRDVIEVLIEAGSDPLERSEFYDGTNAVEMAETNGHFLLADWMRDQPSSE